MAVLPELRKLVPAYLRIPPSRLSARNLVLQGGVQDA